jgi:protein TonB
MALAASLSAQTVDRISAARLLHSPYAVDDYPVQALKAGESGYVVIEVTVAPDGRPTNCTVVASSKSQVLDQKSCAVMLKRGRFAPAVDQAGTPSYGIFRKTVPWFVATSPDAMRALRTQHPAPSEVDVEIAVDRLPVGLGSPIVVAVTVMVDPAGKVTDCALTDGGNVTARALPACRQVMSTIAFKPAVGSDGAPVASVQQAMVAFVVDVASVRQPQ